VYACSIFFDLGWKSNAGILPFPRARFAFHAFDAFFNERRLKSVEILWCRVSISAYFNGVWYQGACKSRAGATSELTLLSLLQQQYTQLSHAVAKASFLHQQQEDQGIDMTQVSPKNILAKIFSCLKGRKKSVKTNLSWIYQCFVEILVFFLAK
jgi:hypothetical protein